VALTKGKKYVLTLKVASKTVPSNSFVESREIFLFERKQLLTRARAIDQSIQKIAVNIYMFHDHAHKLAEALIVRFAQVTEQERISARATSDDSTRIV